LAKKTRPSPVKKRQAVTKKKAPRKQEKIKRRKIELTPISRHILGSIALGSDSVSDISNALNMDRERIEAETNRLAERGVLIERGGFLSKRFDITAQGYEVLGNAILRLEVSTSSTSIKSGSSAKLMVTAKNIGNTPITDAMIKIVSPRFIKISRHGSEYFEDVDTYVLHCPLTHLNPGEVQTMEFNLHGSLPAGTVSSKYKILVHAMAGDAVSDKKELGIYIES